MRFRGFEDKTRVFSIVLFVQPDDVERLRVDLEELGSLLNVQLVVQPCPFEGIEFLYRVAHELVRHRVSMDKELFWQAIELKKDTTEETVKRISDHQHQYLCGILEQDPKKVEREGKVLRSLSAHFS